MLGAYIHGIGVAVKGVPMTLLVTSVAVLMGLIIGLLVALAKMSRFRGLRVIGSVYVEVIRGTPLLVQLLILAYGVPQLVTALSDGAIRFNWPTLVLAAILACGMNSSAYMAEIVRSGLQAIEVGQIEAARSLGMSHNKTMRYIVIPQAFRIILPALGNEFVTLIKETAILSMVGIIEITRRGVLWASSDFQSFPAYVGVAIIYLCMTIPLSRLVAWLERRMAQSDRS